MKRKHDIPKTEPVLPDNKDLSVNKEQPKISNFKKYFKPVLTIFIIIIFIVAIALTVLLVFRSNKNASKSTNVAEPTDIDYGINEAINLATPENIQTSVADLKAQADIAKDNSKKAEYYHGISLIYLNNNENDKCKTNALKAFEYSQSAIDAALVAKCAYNLGDYKTAVQYYGIAADKSENPNDPKKNVPYNDYIYYKKQAQGKL